MSERRTTSGRPASGSIIRRTGLWSQDVLVAAAITVLAVALLGLTWNQSAPSLLTHVDVTSEKDGPQR